MRKKILHPLLHQKARSQVEKREGNAVLRIDQDGAKWGYSAIDQKGEIFYQLHPCDWCGPELAVKLGVKALAKQGISRDALVRVSFRDQNPVLRLSECLLKSFWKKLQGGIYAAI